MVLFSVIGIYCYDKFSLFVLILGRTVFLTKIRSLPFSYAKFSVFLVHNFCRNLVPLNIFFKNKQQEHTLDYNTALRQVKLS